MLDHRMLLEHVQMDQAYNRSMAIMALWITVVVETLVAAGISVLVAHRQTTVFLREQNGSTILPLRDTIKPYQYEKHA